MLVVDLHCDQGHVFEGWFASAEDLASQRSRGLLSCPVCGARDVSRRPAASRLNVSSLKQQGASAAESAEQAPERAPTQAVEALQAMYLQAVKHVLQHTEDVGEHFVQEVRDMHRGDAPQRAVRGQADRDEVAELREEGIDVVSMPIPKGLDGPLQ
jgi:hypothetical protein